MHDTSYCNHVFYFTAAQQKESSQVGLGLVLGFHLISGLRCQVHSEFNVNIFLVVENSKRNNTEI